MSFAAMSRAEFWRVPNTATRHWQASPRPEVLLPANFARATRRIARGKNQPAPRANRIAKKIRMAITAVIAKRANPDRDLAQTQVFFRPVAGHWSLAARQLPISRDRQPS